MLIETDSPYLAPVPYRGKPNQPIYVQQVAACVAEIKQLSLEEVAAQTTNNYNRCFPKVNL
jgi:TatD DNase family protein